MEATRRKPTAPARLPVTAENIRVDLWIKWQDETGADRLDQVRSWGTGGITCVKGSARWDAEGLRQAPNGATEAELRERLAAGTVTPPSPAPDLGAGDVTRITRIRLALIDESPFNPRKTFDLVSLGELAENIAEHGLIDPLLVRPKDGGRFELVDGARRRRACLMTELVEVGVRIQEMDDDTALGIMFDTQTHREPLNEIDKADALLVLVQDAGSQRKLAKRLKLDQSTISRATAIAKLPEDVKQLGRDSRLSGSHLARLAKWADRPAICSAMAAAAVQSGASVRELEVALPFHQQLLAAKLLRKAGKYDGARFDLDAAKAAHPAAFVDLNHYEGYCLDVELFGRLQQEGKAEQARVAAAQREALQQASGLTAGDLDALPRLCDLKHGTYACPYEEWQRTPSCTGACLCRVKALARDGVRIVEICVNPARLASLQERDREAAEAARRAEAQDLLALCFARLRESGEVSARDLSYAVSYGVDYRQALNALALDVPDQPAPNDVAALPAVDARNLVVLGRALFQIEQYVRNGHHKLDSLRAYLGVEPPPPDTERCARCEAEIPGEIVQALQVQMEDDRVTLGDPESGVIVTAHGLPYCRECAQTIRICRECGCTDESGCEEGCAWIAPNLCSVCARMLGAESMEPGAEVLCPGCGVQLDPHSPDGLAGVLRDGRVVSACDACAATERAAALAAAVEGSDL